MLSLLGGLALLAVVMIVYLVFTVGKRDPRLPPGGFVVFAFDFNADMHMWPQRTTDATDSRQLAPDPTQAHTPPVRAVGQGIRRDLLAQGRLRDVHHPIVTAPHQGAGQQEVQHLQPPSALACRRHDRGWRPCPSDAILGPVEGVPQAGASVLPGGHGREASHRGRQRRGRPNAPRLHLGARGLHEAPQAV